jgi:ankyrin repeat protein
MKLMRAANFDDIEEAKKLIAEGADVSEQDKFGYTPLHIAANHGAYAVAELLLKNGAKLNIANNDGHTPLDYAAMFGKAKMAYLFIQNGAKTTVVNRCGKLPSFYAKSHFESLAQAIDKNDNWATAFSEEAKRDEKANKAREEARKAMVREREALHGGKSLNVNTNVNVNVNRTDETFGLRK